MATKRSRLFRDGRQLLLPLVCVIEYSDLQYLRFQMQEVAWLVVKDGLRQLRDSPDSCRSEEILLWMLNRDSDFESWCKTAGLSPWRIEEFIRWRHREQIKRLAKKLVTWSIRQASSCQDANQKKSLTDWIMDPNSDFKEWLSLADITSAIEETEKRGEARMAA